MPREKHAQFKVLIFADNTEDKGLIQNYLQHQSDREFIVVRAHHKSEIEAVFTEGAFNLVLLDIDMENKSNLYWLKQLVEKRIAPVVVMTEHGSEAIVMQSLQQGAVGYINKTNFSREQLVGVIDNAIKKWKVMLRSIAHQDELERLATLDSLTGLLNRRASISRFKESIKQARRYGEEICVILMDIDNFKHINDTFGHKTGDETLKRVAALLQRRLRESDAVGRYGGDEFLIISSHTSEADAIQPAERIRKAIEALRLKSIRGETFSITVSLGIEMYRPGDDFDSIINRVDSKLYWAKKNGRNRVQA